MPSLSFGLCLFTAVVFFALVSLPHRMGVQRQKWQKLVEFVLLTVKSMVLFFLCVNDVNQSSNIIFAMYETSFFQKKMCFLNFSSNVADCKRDSLMTMAAAATAFVCNSFIRCTYLSLSLLLCIQSTTYGFMIALFLFLRTFVESPWISYQTFTIKSNHLVGTRRKNTVLIKLCVTHPTRIIDRTINFLRISRSFSSSTFRFCASFHKNF